MIAIWMLGATAVPINVRLNAAGRALLAGEFDLMAMIEDRRLSAAGYDAILVDAKWPISSRDTIAVRFLRAGRLQLHSSP